MTVKLEVGKAYRTRGGERVEIHEHHSGAAYPFIGITGSGQEQRTYTHGGRWGAGPSEKDLISEWHDEPTEPEIDWGGELQIFDPDEPEEGWNDVTVVWHDDEWVVGWHTSKCPGWAESWKLSDWQFRNKPAEVKQIRGWINMFAFPGHATCVHFSESKPQQHPCSIAIIPIDVAEVEGLNND